MGPSMNDRQLAEVFVEGHQDPAFAVGVGKDLVVPGIFGPITGPHHVMSGGLKLKPSAAPDTGVQEKPHALGSRTRGSIRS
jgi:hypothetical protein